MKCFFSLLSLLYIFHSESMNTYINCKDEFVKGDYNSCTNKMSNIILTQNADNETYNRYAKKFLKIFFPRMKQENPDLEDIDDHVNAIIQNACDINKYDKQSFSLVAIERGKHLFYHGKYDPAQKWLFFARELDPDNEEIECLLQDISGTTKDPAEEYPSYESMEF